MSTKIRSGNMERANPQFGLASVVAVGLLLAIAGASREAAPMTPLPDAVTVQTAQDAKLRALVPPVLATVRTGDRVVIVAGKGKWSLVRYSPEGNEPVEGYVRTAALVNLADGAEALRETPLYAPERPLVATIPQGRSVAVVGFVPSGYVVRYRSPEGAVVQGLLRAGDVVETEALRLARKAAKPAAPEPAVGVLVASVDKEFKRLLDEEGFAPLPVSGGAVIARLVLWGPAQKAGLRPADIIAAVDGKPLQDAGALSAAISELTAGRLAVVTILRAGARGTHGRIAWEWKQVSIMPCAEDVMLRNARRCPLSLETASLGYNIIGEPTVRLVVRNIAPVDVVAYKVDIHCFDRFDNPVRCSIPPDGNVFRGIAQETVKPGETSGQLSYWTLHFYDNTARVTVVLTKVRLEDGSEWESDQRQISISAESRR